jgi:hypothetical protein
MILTKRKCIWGERKCPLKKIKKVNNNNNTNFYEDYIKDYFQTTLAEVKSKKCNKCEMSINEKWFNEDTSYKIFNSVYGQHHRGWNNYYNFVNKNKINTHEKIIKKISNLISIKKYSEFNCPFQGNFFSFLSQSYNIKNAKKTISLSNKRIRLTHLAGKNPKIFKKNFKQISIINSQIRKLKKKNKLKIEKFLILDHSSSCWGDGCVSKSINCRSIAHEIFDLKILNLQEIKDKKFNFDLFSLFNTFDHTSEPKKILDFALKNSKIVLVLNHADPSVTKQHLFSLQDTFLNYLNKKKIFSVNISSDNNNENNQNVMFLCTKSKKIEKVIKKNISNFL